MSDTSTTPAQDDELAPNLPDAPARAAPAQNNDELAPGLPDASDAGALRDFTAWRTQNAGVDAGRAADVLRYAARYKLPSRFVADNFDEVRSHSDRGELASRLSYAPTVERFISQDPVLGAATKDDTSRLSWLERNITGKWETTPDTSPWAWSGDFAGDPATQSLRAPDWLLKLKEGAQDVGKSLTATRLAVEGDDTGFKKLTSSVRAALADDDSPEARQALADLAENEGDLPEQRTKLEQALAQKQEQLAQTEREIGPESLAHRIALAPFKMAPYLGGVVAASAAAGPGGAFVFNWSQTYGNDYLHFRSLQRQDGTALLSDDEARSLAGTTANLSAGLQTVLDLPMLKGLPLGEALAQRLTGQAIGEALGETGLRQVGREFARGGVHLAAGAGLMATQAAAERAGEYAARVSHGDEDHAGQIAQAGVEGFVQALPDFLLMSGYAPAHALIEETGRRFNAPRESQRLKQITDAARDSLIVQKNPGGKGEELIGAMAANSDASTVYVTLDQWKRHWSEAGLDPAEVAARVMGDGGKGYAQADASKSDLPIPIERYVTQLAPKGHADALQEHVKLSQDGLTPAEYVAQLEQEAKGLTAGSPAYDAFHEVFEDYRARALAAGVPLRDAEANAQFMARAMNLWAEKQGQGKSALDLYRENPIRVVGANGQFLATTAEAPVEAPTPINRAARAEEPERKAAQPVVITPQMPKGEPVKYALLESSDLVPSHDPNGFGPNPAYPPGVQERNYLGQPEEQKKVVSGGHGLNPQLLLTDTPSPLDGPPLVTGGKKALVLGGNGRSMMVQRAFQDAMQRERYRAELIRKAESFGLKAQDVEKMTAPVLVRVVDGLTSDSSKEDLIAAVRRFNEGMTQQLSPRARAIAESRTLTPETMQSLGEMLAGAGDQSLRDVMRDDPKRVVDILRRDGVVNEQNQAQYLSGGRLTDEAKDRIEGMFLGRVMENEQRFADTAPELLKKIERLTPYLMRVAGTNPALDETSTVRAAVDLLNDAQRRGLPLRDVAAQGDLFGGGPRIDPAVVAMAELLDKSGQRKIGEVFKAWAQHTAVDPRQVSMFGTQPTLGSGREALFGKAAQKTLLQGGMVRSPKLQYEALRTEQGDILYHHPDGNGLSDAEESRLKEISAQMGALERLHGTATLHQEPRPIADLDGAPVRLNEDERGFVRIFAGGQDGRSYEINLRNPDRSTLAHETFHVLSVIMGDVAQGAKDPQLKADYDGLLKAMGYASHDERQTALDPAKEERASHWWEQYLAEGKAPTPELAGAFNRFKTWLLKIYKGVQGVSNQYAGAYGKALPQLSDEVRGIFDRMLASQEEIAAARGKTGGDAFTEELKKKLPEEAARAVEMGRVYALTVQEQELAGRMKNAEDARGLLDKEEAKVRTEVEREAAADPAARAMHFFRTGELRSLDGELLPWLSEQFKTEDGKTPKLDRQILTDRYGKEVADALPADIVRHGGIDPDLLTAAFGFGSGEEMVHALAVLPADPAQNIADEVRQRMAERYPTLLNDPHVMANVALDVSHGETQAKQIVRELLALAQHVDPSLKPKAQAIDLAAMRSVAARLIADKPVAQLAPDYYLKAERDAAQRAFEAMRKGDTAVAFGERSAQLLNLHLWREARDAKKLVDSAVKYLRDQTSNDQRRVLGKAGPEFLNGIDAVLSALRLEKNNQAVQAAPDAGAYDALVARMQDAQVPLDPSDSAAIRSLLTQPRDWQRLTLGELQNVRDFVKTARQVAKAQNEVNSFGAKLDLTAAVQTLTTEAAAANPDLGPQIDDQSQITRAQRLQAGARAWDVGALRAETLWRKLGAMGGRIFDGYIERRNLKEKLAGEILKDLEDSFDKAGKDFKGRLDEVLPLDETLPQNGTDLGGPRSRRWLMMLALNLGNAGNAQRAIEGRGWTMEQAKATIGKYLSREELGFVQSRWDAMEPLYKLIAEKEARKTGLAPEKVAAVPLELKLADGSALTLPGGYWPAKYDPRVSRSGIGAQQQAAGGIQAFYGQDYRRATTQKSHTKARADSYQNVVNLNWSVYPSHIAQVIHDVAFDEYVTDTAKVLNHDQVQYGLRHSLGIEGAEELRTWLKVVATQQTGSAPSTAEKALGPVMSWLRARVVMSAIVGSAPVLLSQVAHPLIAAGAGELGALNAAASLPKALLPDVRAFALANSAELRHRDARSVAALNERLRDIGAPDKGLLATASHIVEHGMHLVDGYVSTAVWNAAMNDAKGKGMEDAAAFKYADDKVRQLMPTHEKAEMPALLRDRGVIGSLLMAHGFQNTLYNVARTSWHERGALEATGRILAMTLVSGLAGSLLLGHGKEDDETWGQWSLRKAVAAPFELVPFLPNVSEPLIDRLVTGKAKKADVRNAPALAGMQTLMEGYGQLASDNATSADKFWAAAQLALFAGKLPARQIARTGRYLQDEAGSDLSHGRIGDFGSGLAYGSKAKRRTATPFDAARDLTTTITR